MKLYLAICEDRHVDVQVEVFSTAKAAIKWAEEAVRERCRTPDDYESDEIDDGWLYCGHYSTEGDGIHVVETELHPD